MSISMVSPMIFLVTLSCSDKSKEASINETAACDRELHSWSAEDESDGDAMVEVEIESNGELRSVLLSVASADGDNLPLLYEIEDPDGEIQFSAEEWWSSPDILTMAPFPFSTISIANWPVLPDEEREMAEGLWFFRFKTLNNWNYADDPQEPVKITVHENSASEARRCLHVQIVWTEGLTESDRLVEDVETAMDVFEGILALQDIDIHATWIESGLDPVLPSPGEGSAEILELVAAGPPDTLSIIIGETIEVLSEGLAGESGGIPGALHATDHSAVVIAWLELAGISGSLEDSEVQMLGETIAHEVGHYTGLVHPVQFDEDLNIVAWDALEDTSHCNDVDICIEKLSSNVMFPYLLCDWTDYCDSQDEVTPQQSLVMRTYTGVR
jgi:hypothetical protein